MTPDLKKCPEVSNMFEILIVEDPGSYVHPLMVPTHLANRIEQGPELVRSQKQ